MNVRYERAPDNPQWWCSSHRRIATHVRIREGTEHPEWNPPEHCCDPSLGGIMLPCRCEIISDCRLTFSDCIVWSLSKGKQ